MALSAEQLIDYNFNLSTSLVAEARAAVGEIALHRGVRGFTTFDIGQTPLTANYVRVAADTTPMPVYEPPTQTLPKSPTLVALQGVDQPNLPATPTINTSGLFKQVQPSNNIPDWTETAPDLHVDDIYNALVAIGQPVLDKIQLPELKRLSIPDAPALVLPEYERQPKPDPLRAPVNYAQAFKAEYANAQPSIKAFVDDMLDGMLQRYAPEYDQTRAILNTKLIAALDGGVLPDDFEAALYSRHQVRINRETSRAEQDIINNPAYRGWVVPPGAQRSALDSLQVDAVRALSGASTDVYIERRRSEVSFLQYVLGLLDGQLNSVRGQLVQWAQVGLSVIQQSVALASQVVSALQTQFEHEKAVAEYDLAVMQALNAEFEVRLKAALSGLDGYRLELEALKLRSDIDINQLQAAKIQVDIQQLEVQVYSAIVDAIAKRATSSCARTRNGPASGLHKFLQGIDRFARPVAAADSKYYVLSE